MTSNGSSYGTAESSNDEIMLFGVRVKVDPMRKSVSMNNLSQYEQPNGNKNDDVVAVAVAGDTGYASADDALPHQATGGRERKRGVAWTEEEHKLFLLGLQKVGKGDWRGISRNFVKTRTPTQVASHAQKYFLRRNNLNRRRRRSSLFDITTDSVNAIPMEEGNNSQDKSNHQVLTTIASNMSTFPNTMFPDGVETFSFGEGGRSTMFLVAPIPSSSTMVDLNLNPSYGIEQTQLSLKLSLSMDQSQWSSSFQVMSSFNNGESESKGKSIISVA